MILAGLAAALWWARRRRTGWRLLAVGALGWLVSVGLKAAWAIPAAGPLWKLLEPSLGRTPAAWVFWAYTGLLTGIFECGVPWLLIRRTRLRETGREGAVAYGIGFGAVEAILVGAASFAGALLAVVFYPLLPADVQHQVSAAYGPAWTAALPVAERILSMPGHVLACVLLFLSVRTGRARWFWLAFLLKSLVDFYAPAATALLRIHDSPFGWLLLELGLVPFALVETFFLFRVWKLYPVGNDSAEAPPSEPVW